MADKDPYCGKSGVVPAGRNVPRDPGGLVDAILGTLSIDNEMHDDDVRNLRRIGSRVSFLVGKRKVKVIPQYCIAHPYCA